MDEFIRDIVDDFVDGMKHSTVDFSNLGGFGWEEIVSMKLDKFRSNLTSALKEAYREGRTSEPKSV